MGKQLQWRSADLIDLDRNFRDLLAEKRLPHIVGCEALENHFILHWKWLPIFTKTVVVNEESGAHYFASGTMLGGTDHFTIVKPSGIKDRIILDYLIPKTKRIVMQVF